MPATVNPPTDMHLPSDDAPTLTNEYARCKVCGIQWQIRSEDRTDADGCNFCGANKDAILIRSEDPRRRSLG